MTLTEFLLARIAEDERDGWEVHVQGCPSVRDVPFPCECGYPARVLAECEAKRRIVETFSFENDAGSAVDEWMSTGLTPPPAVAALTRVATLLALPYADHPDFHEAWRA